jgi:hypothetical protein
MNLNIPLPHLCHLLHKQSFVASHFSRPIAPSMGVPQQSMEHQACCMHEYAPSTSTSNETDKKHVRLLIYTIFNEEQLS